MKIIKLKKQVCDGIDRFFVVINQKGIDLIFFDLFVCEGIVVLRRVKWRNMEWFVLICGGEVVELVEDLILDVFGEVGVVYEYVFGEEKYIFVENVKNFYFCIIFIIGFNDYIIV